MTRSRLHFAPLLSFTAALGLLSLAGCDAHRPPDNLAQAVQMGEKPVAMEGTDTFFGGEIEVTVTVSRGIGHGTGHGGPGGHHGGGGGGGGRPPEMPDISGMETDDANAYMRAKMAVGSPMPPVTLHLKLHNKTDITASVTLIDFDSDLGNFAIHPDVLSLAPDQVAEPDTMVSQLGVGSDEIPFKVTLKRGGRKETKMVLVRALTPSQPPAAK